MTLGHAPGLSLRRCCSIGPVGLETEREKLHGEMGIPSPGLEQEGKAEVSTKLSSNQAVELLV